MAVSLYPSDQPGGLTGIVRPVMRSCSHRSPFRHTSSIRCSIIQSFASASANWLQTQWSTDLPSLSLIVRSASWWKRRAD